MDSDEMKIAALGILSGLGVAVIVFCACWAAEDYSEGLGQVVGCILLFQYSCMRPREANRG